MYRHIYDCFSHWYNANRATIWLYSDPHFSDKEMHYLRGSFPDEEQVRRINSKVGKNDTLIILGDIGDPSYLKLLRGYKVLILGNHDAGATTYGKYAEEIYEGPLFISDRILLSHEPIILPFVYNIHGHSHGQLSVASNELNICAESINYTPVSFKKIIESGALKDIDNIHRITINEATQRHSTNTILK